MNKLNILEEPGLYVITDITMAGKRQYIEIVRDILMGECRIIEIRDRVTPFENLVAIGKVLKSLTAEYGALLIIDGNPYLAREVGADGIHLGPNDIPIDIAQEIVGPECLIGLSTHTIREMTRTIITQDVDYITLGPIFSAAGDPPDLQTISLRVLKWAADNVPFPVVAVGGINVDNISRVVSTGMKCIGVQSAVMKAPDMITASKELSDIIRKQYNPS